MTAVIVAAAFLPFLLLVKLALLLYLDFGASPYAALTLAATCTLLLLLLYTLVIGYRLTGRIRLSTLTWRGLAILVVVFCLYSMVFISVGNVKSAEVRETYSQLHPLLRLSVSTLVLVDGNAVVTDAARRREDYARMGLPANERSLHLVQASGYVHALDLRTIGRGGVRNFLVAAYFEAMGMSTIRHVGTADHLHISLPVRDS